MLADRPYMSKAEEFRPFRSVSIILMIVLTGAFALQQINAVYIHANIYPYLLLSPAGLKRGFLWQLLTFQFFHAGLWHLICNLIGLWCFGPSVEGRLGPRHFLKVYFGSGMLGGAVHALLGLVFPDYFGAGPVLGASAGICGLLAAYAILNPEGEILICFVLPIRAKHLLFISLGVALFFTIVPSDPGMAHAAHLGGLLGGIAYIRWIVMADKPWFDFRRFRPVRRRPLQLVRVGTDKSVLGRSAKSGTVRELPSDEFISKEIDPILDKISAHGIHSLTEREKKILEAARARMGKR